MANQLTRPSTDSGDRSPQPLGAATSTSSTRWRQLGRRWYPLAIFAGLVAVHLWTGLQMEGPLVQADEGGYLGNTRWLLGDDVVYRMSTANFYHLGYSVLLIPAFLLGGDPGTTYSLVMVTNALLMASVFPLTALMLMHGFGVARDRAMLAAGVAAAYPAVLLHSNLAWAENAVFPLFPLLLLGAAVFLRPSSPWPARLVIGMVAVALHAVHPRLLPVLVITAGLVAVAGLVRAVSWKVAGPNLAVMIVGWAAVRLATRAMIDARHSAGYAADVKATPGGYIDLLLSPSQWPSTAAEAAGQAWYLIAGSFGLVVLAGLFLAGLWTGAERLRRPEEWTGRDRRMALGGFLAVVVAGVFLTSALAIHDGGERMDHLIYGRYNETFAPTLIALGVVWLISGQSSRRRLLAGAAIAAVVTVLAVSVLAARGRDRFDDVAVPANIWAIHPFIDDTETAVDRATAAGLAGIAAITVAGLRWRRAVGVGVGVSFLLVSVSGAGVLERDTEQSYGDWHLPEQLRRLGTPEVVSYDYSYVRPFAFWGYQYWLDDLQMHVFRSTRGEEPTSEMVIGPVDWPLARELDARIVVIDGRNAQAVWVLPGERQDELAEAGWLLPEGFPSHLPDAAMDAQLDLLSPDRPLTLAPGETAVLQLRVTHAGEASPWPAFTDWGLAGLVRIGGRWLEPGGEVVPGAEHRGELPATLYPGDEVTAHLTVEAVDARGAPLPPGRYALEVALLQDGVAWFTEAGDEALRIPVRVTGR